MNVLRVPLKSFLVSLGCAWFAFVAGCATTPKSAEPATASPSTPALPPPTTAVKVPAPETAIVAPPVAPTPTQTKAPAPVSSTAPTPATPPPVAKVLPKATIKGSQESSLLFDNFTSFVAAVDGKKIEAGRDGWDNALEIEAGHHTLKVEFNRGVFFSRATLEFKAAPKVKYQLRFATDAELFGHNSYCNFWLVNADTDQEVTPVVKAAVEKLPSPQG